MRFLQWLRAFITIRRRRRQQQETLDQSTQQASLQARAASSTSMFHGVGIVNIHGGLFFIVNGKQAQYCVVLYWIIIPTAPSAEPETPSPTPEGENTATSGTPANDVDEEVCATAA